MSALQAAILGLIQGLTEFLPVSSSGHLIFIPKLLGWADQGVAFDLVLDLGTVLALVIYFRKKLWLLLCAAFSKKQEKKSDRRLAWLIAFSAIPAGIVGLILKTNDRNALAVGVNLIVWGLVLGIADWYGQRNLKSNDPSQSAGQLQGSETEIQTIAPKKVWMMSFAQILALFPGTSRSGITITAGLFSGLSRAAAAEFSFLMSVPITAMAGLDAMYKLYKLHFIGYTASNLTIGFLFAFVSGMLAIKTLMVVIKKWSYKPFVVYRIVVGALVLWFLL